MAADFQQETTQLAADFQQETKKPVLETIGKTFKLHYTANDVLFHDDNDKYLDLENNKLLFPMYGSFSTNRFTMLFAGKYLAEVCIKYAELNVGRMQFKVENFYQYEKLDRNAATNKGERVEYYIRINLDNVRTAIANAINKYPTFLSKFDRVYFSN